jgi:hypothetical protein
MAWQSFANFPPRRSAARGQRKAGRTQLKLSVEALEPRELPATILAAPLHYDFGTTMSPVASGQTGAALVAYTDTLGYGWQSLAGLSAMDRHTSNALTNDCVSGGNGTFLVNLPNGTYDVTPTLGDVQGSMSNVDVRAQGNLVGAGLHTNYGQIITPTYQVQLTNGQLQLQFEANGGNGNAFALDRLDIAPAAGSPASANAAPNTRSSRSATGGPWVYTPTTGIYVLGNRDGPIDTSILNNSNVDGLSVRATWDYIEPTQGNFNWSYIDGQINDAAAAGKKVSLSIAAGTFTPSWVYSAGAQAFTFIDNTSPTPQTMPLPWDPVFLTQWTNFITQLGNRYAGNATLTQVKLAGVNYSTAETMLPISTGVQVTLGTQTWTTTNDVADWLAAGYTRTKVENAWQTIADAWSQAFPSQQISAILVANHFPPIDNNGNVFSTPSGGDNQIVTDLINLGIARYGSQFALQNNGWSDPYIMPELTAVADEVTTGYQELWYVTGDSTYRMNNGTPIAITTELQNAVNPALAAHARFLEIYPEDTTNSTLQSVMSSAHKGLVNNNLPLGMITGLPAPGSVLEGNNTFTLGSALADPTTNSSSGFTYAWTVQHNSQTVATGTASSLTFSANDWGAYVVSLKVTDPSGVASFVNTQTISIINVAPTITQYNVPLTTTMKVPTTFSAAATDPGAADTAAGLTYTWKFGNLDTATGSTVTYSYPWYNTYTVKLTVTDAGGSSTTTSSTILVTQPTHSPEGAAITVSASSLPAPTGVSFTGATYAWTVTKNGSNYATGSAANITFTPNDVSSYDVTLTVTSAAGQSWTDIVQYTIDNLPPTITKLSVPGTGKEGSAIQVSVTATDPGAADNAAGLTYTWWFGDGTVVTGVSATSHKYGYEGTYTIYLTVADQEGAKTNTNVKITIVD